MSEPVCGCPVSGFCERYQIYQPDYAHGICSGRGTDGKPCSPEKSNAFRAKWRKRLADKLAGKTPGIVQRAANAAKAFVRSAATGFKQTPPDILAHRQALCEACEFHRKDKGICIHPKCGCLLKRGLLTKLQVLSERCPMGKW